MGNTPSTTSYKFKDNKEFREGIRVWFSGEENKYGHISTWNTEKIKDMSYLLSYYHIQL